MKTTYSPVGQLSLTPISESAVSLDTFEKYLVQEGRCSNTAQEYCSAVRRYLDYRNPLGNITPAMAWLQWDKSPSMKKLTGHALKAYEQFLDEFLPGHDFKSGVPARLKNPARPNPQPIASEDIRKLHRTAKKILSKDSGLSLRVWMELLNEVGARRSGGADVTWSDINWVESSVIIRTKGEKVQELPISRKLLRMFSVLRKRSTQSIWIGARGQTLGPAGLAYLFKKVAKACNLNSVKTHHFRHTRLTALGNAENFNPILFQAVSGHADMSSAKFYVKPAMDRVRAVLEASRKNR